MGLCWGMTNAQSIKRQEKDSHDPDPLKGSHEIDLNL